MNRTMEQAGAGLEKIVASSLRRAPAGQGPVLAWALACGHAVAVRTRAIDFVQGILRVEVPDWGWRAELQASGAAVSGGDQSLRGRECQAD